ncbi:MAG: tyrosine-type recombinase/integrase [Sedimentisphaerales bacterium]|nr:tyrosine-type recombinase/integrase [Sedimentisphaerales bacterium]
MAKHSLTKRKRRDKNTPWVHPSGRWVKKHAGRAYYLGKVSDDPDGKLACEEWLRIRPDVLKGRRPQPAGGVELRAVANAFLAAKDRSMQAGEIKPSSFSEYHTICTRMIAFFGARRVVADLVGDDFGAFRAELAKTYGPVGLVKRIQIVKSIFKYAWESGVIEHPPRLGADFKRPSAKVLRLARAAAGDRTYTAKEIRQMIDAAGVQVRAMIYMGINAALGNTDVAELPKDAIDWETGILSFPRPKTGIPRRVCLWKETLDSLKASIADRPKAKAIEDDRLVFITKYGRSWMRFRPKEDKPGTWVNSVYLEFNKILQKIGIDRSGCGFYGLRHTFRSVADSHPDVHAVNTVMGHEDGRSMRTHYVRSIDDSRLVAVAEHVHRWLYGGV